MAGYKLSKNHWVKPFLVIFRFVRDILLVTVAFDHPVASSSLIAGVAGFRFVFSLTLGVPLVSDHPQNSYCELTK